MTVLRVAGFLVALVAVFGVAMGVGNVVDPVSRLRTAPHDEHAGSAGQQGSGSAAQPGSVPGGLMVSQDGFTFAAAARAGAGPAVPVAFRITGPDGEAVTEYDVQHEKLLHLIAVRRDFTGFQHVHPELDAEGVWRTRLALAPGQWRLFADFKPTGGSPLTLGTDLTVAGTPALAAPTGESRTATVGRYTVALDGDLAAGRDARLTFRVSRDGVPVTDLQPYLGAYGHLVALREGDLAYLHVHPDGSPGDGTTEPGPDVAFYAAVPSTGSYRLFLDFQHEGVVRTAGFALSTSAPAATPAATPGTTQGPDHSEEEDDHGH